MGKIDKHNQRKARNFDDHVISVVSSESSDSSESFDEEQHIRKPMVEKPLTKGQLRAAKKLAKKNRPVEEQKPNMVTKSEPVNPISKKQPDSEFTEEEKPVMKTQSTTSIFVTKTAPMNSKSASKTPIHETSTESAKSSEESAEYSAEEETKLDTEKPALNIIKSNKVTISDRKTKKSEILITSVVNIPNDIDLVRLARALSKVYKCKTRVRCRDGIPTIELKGQHKGNVREFITKTKIVELRQIKFI